MWYVNISAPQGRLRHHITADTPSSNDDICRAAALVAGTTCHTQRSAPVRRSLQSGPCSLAPFVSPCVSVSCSASCS